MNREHEKIERLISRLEDFGCPNRIADQLRDWNDEPVRTMIDLREWIEGCTDSQPACVAVAAKKLKTMIRRSGWPM